jgi:glycosyltransferase involved in cell wall biosynthesis
MRILLVLEVPLDAGWGMSKVHYNLKIAFEKMGHQVDYLDWRKLYPHSQSVYDKMFGSVFQERILEYLKINAHKYDVIDANVKCIPYPKKSFKFKGLLVCRSHGVDPLYSQIMQSAIFKKMEVFNDGRFQKISFKTRIGNAYRSFIRKNGDSDFFASLKNADLVHALTLSDSSYFKELGIAEDKLIVVPNGLDDEFIDKANMTNIAKRKNELSFLAAWRINKGILDLPEILKHIIQHAKIDSVNLLGVGIRKEIIENLFTNIVKNSLQIVPRFNASDLFHLLPNNKVGIFTSYCEGFGLAIVEQLAFGIPVVAYNTSGANSILNEIDTTLLVKVGDTTALANKVIEIINMDELQYLTLCEKCKKRVLDFKIGKIAEMFIELYKKHAN